MRKVKKARIVIVLECSHCKQNSSLSGVCRYKTLKNRKNTPKRLFLKKYCFFSKMHEKFTELK